MGRVRVNVCLCTGSTSWRPLGDMRHGRRVKVTLQAGVLPATLSRAHSAARSSLALMWAATWRPQLVEDGAAGPRGGGPAAHPVSGMLASSSGCGYSLGGAWVSGAD